MRRGEGWGYGVTMPIVEAVGIGGGGRFERLGGGGKGDRNGWQRVFEGSYFGKLSSI